MKVTFDKYHGNGNDFIIVDGINNSFNRITQEKIKSLCDRNTGIGSDGFIIISVIFGSCRQPQFCRMAEPKEDYQSLVF